MDTETTSLRQDEWELLGISFSDGKNSGYIPVGHKQLDGTLLPGQVSLPWLIEFLNEEVFHEKKKVIAHNFVYDYKVLKTIGVDLYSHEWFDTMVASHLLDENDKHGLKHLVLKYFGDDYGIDIQNASKIPLDEVAVYACKDAYYTYKLSEMFYPRLLEEELDKLFFKIEMPFLRAIGDMELEGVLVDWEKVRATTAQLKKELTSLEEQMYCCLEEGYSLQTSLYGDEVYIVGKYNFNSSQQLKEIIINKLGLTIDSTTPSGEASTGKNSLEALRGSHEFIDLLLKHRELSKLKNAFFEPLPRFRQKDDKVRCSFHDTGTRTGRLSSSEPNLQQLPKSSEHLNIGTRSCFIAPSGYRMITCDYSGQELRVLAHITGCEPMIKAFKEGADFHQATADRFGVDRTKAKAINFGVAYGKSAYGFSQDWGVTEEEAQKFLDDYFESFPEIKSKIEATIEQVKNQGWVSSLTGRRRRFVPNEQGYHPSSSFRQAFNFLIQGFSADMIRIAAIKCLNLIRRNPSWGLRMIFTVHDEVGFIVKEEHLEEAVRNIKDCFETAVKLRVPLVADVGIGDNYAEAK